jgi:phage baseplate assembly protein W
MKLRATESQAKGPWAFSQRGNSLLPEIEQVLLTWGPTHLSQGEMPWRCEFGSALHLVQSSSWDHVAEEIVRTYIGDALAQWLPQVRLRSLSAEQVGDCLMINFTVSSEGRGAQTVSLNLGGRLADAR